MTFRPAPRKGRKVWLAALVWTGRTVSRVASAIARIPGIGLAASVVVFAFLWIADDGYIAGVDLETGWFFADSLKFSMPLAMVMLAARAWRQRREELPLREAWRTYLLILASVPLLGFFAAKSINRYWDVSAPKGHAVKAIDKLAFPRNDELTFYAWVESWKGPGDRLRCTVPQDVWTKISPGRTKLRVYTKAGTLRHEWIVSCDIEDGAPEAPFPTGQVQSKDFAAISTSLLRTFFKLNF